jgi:hypothetical protein
MLPLRPAPFALLLVLAAGCGPGNASESVTSSIGPYPIGPGDEKTQCIVFRLDNPEGGFIRNIRAELGAHSHHMTIYRSAGTAERRVPFDCRGFDSVFDGDQPLFIAQQENAALAFPYDEKGQPVGFAIDAHQMVRMEMHYLNTTAEQATSEGRFILDTIPLSRSVVPADIAFWGTNDIHIPPHAAWKTDDKFVLAPEGNRMFALTTHQHSLGTRIRGWYADDVADIDHPPLVDNKSWRDPTLVVFDPPLVFGEGHKKGLAYQCEWANTTPRTVTYGENFHDEMCFLWHYYFPGKGFDHFIQP